MKVEELLKYVACFETRDTWKQAHFLHIFSSTRSNEEWVFYAS